MSSLTWLAYSDAERRRALQVVELLGQSETRDELGLGVVRDAFAEALFPGMSTVQRRARYFLFVPWIFCDIERRFAGRSDIFDRARREELRLIDTLLRAGEHDGVIGARAGRRLQQLPSTIYWQGLRRWGIRRGSGTREQWARAYRRSAPDAIDDDGQVDGGMASWWHNDLVDPPADWPSESDLNLTATEADYLSERIRATCAGTLLAVLAVRTQAWEEQKFSWNLDLPELTVEQRRLLGHARRFSEVMHGAALVYNLELALATEHERVDYYRDLLADWTVQEARADRDDYPLEDLWEQLKAIGSRHTPATKQFVERWVRLARTPEEVGRGPAAADVVRERERQVKKTQARLSFDAARDTWRGAAGAGQLDYRWSSAQRQLLDIVTAEA